MKTDSPRYLAIIITALSLGSVAGISGGHYFHMKQVVAQHEQELARVALLERESINQPLAPTAVELAAAHAAELQQEHNQTLLELLTEMRTEQRAIRSQLAETKSKLGKVNIDLAETSRDLVVTNRDLAEAKFRLDTHSESFKPLDRESDRPRKLEPSSTEIEVDLGPGLLPPINR